MKKTIFLLLFTLALGCISLKAQLKPVFNVASPEVANLGLYGTVPVSLYTGVPDISVPLYEMKVGNYTLPLSVSYHLGALKVNSQSGCLGMGWNLIAGGYITRTIRGCYDEQQWSSGYSPGFYDNAYRLKNMTSEQFDDYNLRFSPNNSDSPYELSADEFSFNFCGYTGNFYYNEDNGWTVVSDQDIKVEFHSNGDGFVNLDTIRKRIHTDGWGRVNQNNRFFNKFTLITPDGTRYEFGGINAMEFSIPYYARHNSDLMLTTWRLAKITTVEGRTIRFTYDTSGILCDLRYVPQYKMTNDNRLATFQPWSIGKAGLTGFLIFPVNIKKIETNNEVVEFNYLPEVNYASMFGNAQLAWIDQNAPRRDYFHLQDSENPSDQFHLFLNFTNPDNNLSLLLDRVKEKLRNNILFYIQVQPKRSGKAKTLFFDYTFNNKRKLSLITQWAGLQEPEVSYVSGGGVLIPHHYTIPDLPAHIMEDHNKRLPTYRFVYNTTEKIPLPNVTSCMYLGTDSWGYYNGQTISSTASPNFNINLPVLSKAKAEILEEIIYPTGGKTCFEYENNNYSLVVNENRTSMTQTSGIGGGIRIKSITNFDANNNFLGKKLYSYTIAHNSNVSSGVLKELPVFSIQFVNAESGNSTQGYNIEFKSKGGYYSSATNRNTPDISYSKVFEETLNENGESEGYICHEYSNYSTSPTYMDEQPIYSTVIGNMYIKPYSSHAIERGKPLRKDYYNENGELLKRVSFTYNIINSGFFFTVDQKKFVWGNLQSDFAEVKTLVGSITKTYTYSYLPTSKIEKEYAVDLGGISEDSLANIIPIEDNYIEFPSVTPSYVKEIEYEYNTHKLLKKETLSIGNGSTRVTDYKYPSDFSTYIWMVNKHIISPFVETKVQEDGKSKTLTATYGNRAGIPYIQKLDNTTGIVSRTTYMVTQTDVYGNPVEIVEKEKHCVLVWGYDGQCLIARIENATLKQVRDTTGVNPVEFSIQNTPDYLWLTNNRHLMPLAQCYIYKYDGDLRLTSVTDPNGIMTFYEYDVLGRLTATYIQNNGIKSLQNIYDYRYRQSE